MEFRDRTFKNETVNLDGNTFTGCTFRECVFVYKAMDVFTLTASHFYDCKFSLAGPAMLTLQALAMFYRGMGDGGKALVENTFESIRQNNFPKLP